MQKHTRDLTAVHKFAFDAHPITLHASLYINLTLDLELD